MRALLTPEIAPRMGIVLFRPGSELMPLFMQGRVLLEPEPERYSSFASGAVPAASQPLADDPAVRAVFRNEAVIRRAGGVECLESWLLREKGCQWPHSDWHSENMTTMRHAPGAIRLCWHCDNQLRDQFTERLESMATDNCARWVLSVHCHGKGEVSTACRGCKGKGIVLDEKRTRLHGTPVYKICGRCNGNRFSRLPTTLARHHVQKLVPDLTDYQWYKGYADVIDKLVTKCWQEEAYAEAQLRKVTR
ncbi:antitermination protein [Salmonella enterica]|uniref:antitermination protein Q n=1 Tax=Salmonella enterica TaxID=28901 RepID=UPI003D160EED